MIADFIKKIKQKKELLDIPDQFVLEIIENYLKKHSIHLPEKEKQSRVLIKEIRAQLRDYTGRFQIKADKEKRIELLKENKIEELLKTHSSTKERLPDYSQIIEWIYSENPKSILDLACGINPIAIAKPGTFYYAIDIKEDELELINNFFKKNKIQGKTILSDITKIEYFPKTDISLIFKTLDIIETKSHKRAMEIIKKIKSKQIIASFSAITLSGKKMNSPRRLWFEKMLKSLNYKFEMRKTRNEVFYFVEKN